MLSHYMLFYGAYVGKGVGKATRECGCCMVNVGIRCYVIFQETFLKWSCKFTYYISLSKGVGGVYVILNDEIKNQPVTTPLYLTIIVNAPKI